MGTFNSSRTVPYQVEDLSPVAQDVMRHFESQDFEVTETHIPTGGVQVSIRKGGTFKAIIGLKTALNIKIEPQANGTRVEAGVGIFGQQAIPTAITLLVFLAGSNRPGMEHGTRSQVGRGGFARHRREPEGSFFASTE
jgi:hypothetical protein